MCLATLVAVGVPPAGADNTSPAPARVLTLRETGELELRDSADGHVVRTIAALAPLTGLVSRQIAMTPDGRTAFVERSTAFRPTKTCPRPHPVAPQYALELVAVDIESGRIRSLGRGRSSPVVSPDGATLVYQEHSHCRLGRTIVRSLVTGRAQTVQLTDDAGRQFAPMRFASAEHLDAFASYDGTIARFRITPPSRRGRIVGAQVVAPGGNTTGLTCEGSTFLGARRDGSVDPEPGPWPNWQLAAFDLATGTVTEVFGDLLNHSSFHVTAVEPSCRHALVILRHTSAEDPRAQSPLVLARWSHGDARPTLLGEDVIAAAWMP